MTPGYEVAVAAALGAAADAVAVAAPSAAADALRLLREDDAGRAALLIGGAPEQGERPVLPAGVRPAAELVGGPEELLSAVRTAAARRGAWSPISPTRRS